ncbi:Clp protease N-terminal domain-containing protein [Streptomyces sp. NPDC000594]|uniref:Clp protease N-terminal domain-containing protein n=1 Tax=Streptomyces sp. NPDC000594 TaxID=3154261 RepID=UPI0033257399
MTETVLTADGTGPGVLDVAWGNVPEGGRTIGTEQLLAAVAELVDESSAGKVLSGAGATDAALLAVVRERGRGTNDPGAPAGTGWESTDDRDGTVDAAQALNGRAEPDRLLSGAAARAFTAARELAVQEAAGREPAGQEPAVREGVTGFTADHLLRALLADGANRATETLRGCGITPERILARLDAREYGPADDGLDPALWPTRDILLGRPPQGDVPFLWRQIFTLTQGQNLATVPVVWVIWDTREQARALGRKRSTEHLVLALLATYEAGLAHPHLAGEGGIAPERRLAGGARPARQGLDHAAVLRALAEEPELGKDDDHVDEYLHAARKAGTTGPLLDALLRGRTRAGRLLASLGYVDDAGEKDDDEEDEGAAAELLDLLDAGWVTDIVPVGGKQIRKVWRLLRDPG